MTYEERVEQAIAANDIETLVKFTYGYPCKCTKKKGEPMCIWKKQPALKSFRYLCLVEKLSGSERS